MGTTWVLMVWKTTSNTMGSIAPLKNPAERQRDYAMVAKTPSHAIGFYHGHFHGVPWCRKHYHTPWFFSHGFTMGDFCKGCHPDCMRCQWVYQALSAFLRKMMYFCSNILSGIVKHLLLR
jgi:hypothetical protein